MLNQAENAKEETRGGEIDENIRMWKTERETNKIVGETSSKSKEQLLEELKEKKLLTEDEYQSLVDGKEITVGSRTISIEDEDVKTIVEAFKAGEIKVGDYVNYENPKTGIATVETDLTGYSKSQTYEVDSSTTWRVLGLDEEGDNLLLISGSPIKKSKEDNMEADNPYLVLGGAEGWYNCKETLDKLCEIYKNDLAEKVRSITLEDIMWVYGITANKEEGLAYKDGQECGQYYLPWDERVKYDHGYYALENYLLEKYPDSDKYKNLKKKQVGDSAIGSNVYIPFDKYENIAADIIFYDDDTYYKSYWLPVETLFVMGGDPTYILHKLSYVSNKNLNDTPLFDYEGSWMAERHAIRPIVSLKSNTTTNDLKVIEEVEENWTFEEDSWNDNGKLTAGKID